MKHPGIWRLFEETVALSGGRGTTGRGTGGYFAGDRFQKVHNPTFGCQVDHHSKSLKKPREFL